MRRAKKVTDKQIKTIAELYGVSTDYIRKIMAATYGADEDAEYLLNCVEKIYGTGKDIKEPRQDESFAPLTKKEIAKLSNGYCFLKRHIIEFAREEKANGIEPTKDHMEALLDELLEESAGAQE